MTVATGPGSNRRLARFSGFPLLVVLLCLGWSLLFATTAQADKCGGTVSQPAELGRQGITTPIDNSPPGSKQPDLEVNGVCIVQGGDKTLNGAVQRVLADYYYGKVNITSGGTLIFKEGGRDDIDKVTNFWARSIIVENGGAIKAGVDGDNSYGTNLQTLNIILYGKDQGAGGNGDTCVSTGADLADCGIPSTIWNLNGKGIDSNDTPPTLANGVKDYFYQYGTMFGDGGEKTAYYGYKVLAVGYGGTLQLRGLKGTTGGAAADADPTASGTSWMRLAGGDQADVNLQPAGKQLILDRSVQGDWQPGDKVVVTTTDYLPSHSEELTIATGNDAVKDKTVKVVEGLRFLHVGKTYDLSGLANAGDGFKKAFKDGGLKIPTSAETRAAVALLTRSIRIVSGGDVAGDYFSCANNNVPMALAHDKSKPTPVDKDHCASQRSANYYFGGHTVFRQGFQKLQLQGVEFHQLGQGGRMGHYPVHFHIARQVPSETYIKDSSVSESMTRWYVLHSTQGVKLQRNVGWKSIGHGYYLETGTEADNQFYSNIGIFARAAVQDDPAVTDAARKLNPRNVPGILANNDENVAGVDAARYRSDVLYPTVFWISNGWNEYVGNMAAGAGTCGVGFWLVPQANTDMIELQPMPAAGTPPRRMKWTGYAGRQASWPVLVPTKGWDPASHGGETPVKLFYKNYATTMMHSLNTVGSASDCVGVGPGPNQMHQVRSMAPAPKRGVESASEMYYPNITGNRVPTVCDPTLGWDKEGACTGKYDDAHGVNDNTHPATVAKKCDNQNPNTCGLTVIDHFTTSFHWAETNFSAVWLRTPGWFLMDNSFISDVQNGGLTLVTGGDYSRSSTPVGYWGLLSRSIFVGATQPTNSYALASGPRGASGTIICDRSSNTACISVADSVAYPLSTWATNQRFFNIYDGPAYQDANAYLDINVSPCNDAKTCMYFGTPGVRRYPGTQTGYLPNGAVGWKQPNGFYYPPAFHSKNLYFKNVDIRHYVIEPLYQPGTYLNDDARLQKDFIGLGAGTEFKNFTDIDRQTVLNDVDGTLTGFKNTISVNEDAFFSAPIQASECKSNKGVTPDKACQGKTPDTPPTARTSPYDYVTTVIYPGCAMQNPLGTMPPGWPGACGSYEGPPVPPDGENKGRFQKLPQTGGTWSRDCGGPFCTGVPIYRQYLTSDTSSGNPREWQTWSTKCKPPDANGVVKPECDFPLARMAGASLWQRNVMTVNNGKFYIDTTRSQIDQRSTDALGKKDDVNAAYVECEFKTSKTTACQPRSVSVFEKGQSYYVFFLFAKKEIKQKYQFYVGKQFKPDTGVKGVKVNPFLGAPYSFKDWSDWKSKGWKAVMVGPDGNENPDGDVLEVTVDFSQLAADLDPTKGTCQPGPFCSLSGNTCGCNVTNIATDVRARIDPNFKTTCQNTCSGWAAKDLDCPADGCFGFAFTLPANGDFAASNQYKRPTPSEFPSADWSKFKFIRTTEKPDSSSGGACYYSDGNTPGTDQCKVAD